jgi:hypothetical protein
MKLSHEKLVHLSHVLATALEADGEVTFLRPQNEVRLLTLEVLRQEVLREEEMEQRARDRIASMRRGIAEGSAEWDILFKKYYDDERDKRRRVR